MFDIRLNIIFFAFWYSTSLALGQSKHADTMQEEKRFKQFFNDNKIEEVVGDSSAIYAFAFKVTVEKSNGKFRVVRVSSNDSIAYRMFPKYKRLETMNYELFMGKRDTATFILPVSVEISDSEFNRPSQYATHQVASLFYTSFNEAFQSTVDYIYFQPYSVIIDKAVYD